MTLCCTLPYLFSNSIFITKTIHKHNKQHFSLREAEQKSFKTSSRISLLRFLSFVCVNIQHLIIYIVTKQDINDLALPMCQSTSVQFSYAKKHLHLCYIKKMNAGIFLFYSNLNILKEAILNSLKPIKDLYLDA